MCSPNDPPAGEIMREIKSEIEKSRSDPDGVQYTDHLWEMVKDESDLTVVLRTDTELFADIPVRVWWKHGWYKWQSPDDQEYSALLFDVPDEVCRRIQSQYASNVMAELFGQTTAVNLPKVFREDTDELRVPHSLGYQDGNFFTEVITDDWVMLKQAIKMTSEARNQQPIVVHSSYWNTRGGLARVNDSRLEIYLGKSSVSQINREWKDAFRNKIDAEEISRL